jgi:hypothetical protein
LALDHGYGNLAALPVKGRGDCTSNRHDQDADP